MWIHAFLLCVKACFLIPQDAGPTPGNGVWLELLDAGNSISELQVVLHTEQLVFLDPDWPRVKVLANRNHCYPHWRWPHFDALHTEDPTVVLVGHGHELGMPEYDDRPLEDELGVILDSISSEVITQEVRSATGDLADPWREQEVPCFYRIELKYSLDPWLPGEDPERTHRAFSKRFSIECRDSETSDTTD